jgi:hypothetical protein
MMPVKTLRTSKIASVGDKKHQRSNYWIKLLSPFLFVIGQLAHFISPFLKEPFLW